MPHISVLLAVYNTNIKFLLQAIDSILQQTYRDFELLIVNDCSTDIALDKYLSNIEDTRVKYYKNSKNLGIAATRNKLISLAKGEYLAIMDHDDIALPTRFEKQVKILNNHSDIGVVSTNYKNIPTDKITIQPEHDEDIKIALMRNCVLLHPASMIRKSVILENNISYDNKFSPAEDYQLWCSLINHTKFYNIQEILFHYRIHATNITKTQKEKMNMAKLRIHAQNEILFPILNNQYMNSCTITKRYFIFGFLPLLTLKSKGYHNKLYLFEKILLLSFKKQMKLK